MTLPTVNKNLGITPNPCISVTDSLGQPCKVDARPLHRDIDAIRRWLSPLLELLIEIGAIDESTGDTTTSGLTGFANTILQKLGVFRARLTGTLTRVSDGGTGQVVAMPQYWDRTAIAWTDDTAAAQLTIIDYDDHWSGSSGDYAWVRRLLPESDPSPGQPVGLGQAAAIIWMKTTQADDLPTVAKVVQVNHSGGTAGHLKSANASGYHPGRVVNFNNGTKANSTAIWILFVDHYDTDAGSVIAEQGRFYGPATRSGTATVSADTRPLYVCHVSEHQWLAQCTSAVSKGSSGTFKLYHTSSETDSGLTVSAECKFNAYVANMWAIVTRINGVYYANQIECET